ncbi:hypothetical protein [Deinococcus yavapaiensis]|uniref:Uncharacterized protein n=1 Tax=Deinococcus yavapaiensis KR-236 TaxID=694435 RepID=A0A318RYG4_9DEIO|nr:hypothetical protein [Deinococcus yavapaiensis]PYE47929.1 hypothetical protein DES52_1367 [Deinococcus yavapaiensis KR-236]
MTMANNRPLSSVPQDVQRLLEATLELREAKNVLRRGNVIKGVQRHDRAKKSLHQVMSVLMDASSDMSLRGSFATLVQAGLEFKRAYDAHRSGGAADSRAALELVRAEKKIIGELDSLGRSLN